MTSRSRIALAVGAIVLAGLVLILMRRDTRSAPVPAVPAVPQAAPVAAEPDAARALEPERAQAAVAAAGDAIPSPAPSPRGDTTRVLGRCVAAESGRALAGVRVECTRLGPAERTPLAEPVTTGGDGRFELEVDAGGPVRLDARAPGRSPRIAHWRPLAPGATIDLGDVSLAAGFVVAGQVLERDGAPVADVTVVLSAVFVGIDVGGDDVPASMSGRTDAFGAFRIDGDVPAGEFPVALATRGWRLASPAWVRVDALTGAESVAAVAERLPSIAGHVFDTDGVAVPGVRLSLARGLMPTPPVRTDAEGAFELFAPGDDLEPLRVTIQDPGPCEPPEDPLPAFEWGTRDARIVLRRALTFDLVVVERGSGAPVTGYAVACFPSDSRSSLEQAARHSGTHPEGRLVVERVRRGENRLQVRPAGEGLLASDWIVFEAREVLPPLRVELERMSLARVRVVTASGDPVAGSRVSLHRLAAHAPAPPAWIETGAESTTLLDDTGAWPQIAAGTTDASGEIELRFPSDLQSCALRVTGAEHLELRELHPPLRADAVHEVVVARGARIEGRCVVGGYGEEPLALQFARDDGPASGGVLAMLAPDGGFRSPPLEPGPLAIHLSVPCGANIGLRAPLEPPLQRVALGEGEVLRLELEARAWAAGSLVGNVLVDGTAPASGQLLLQLVLPDVQLPFGPFALDGEGGFALEGLPPGRWTALLFAGGPDYLHTSDAVDLAGGERREVAFGFTLDRRVLRLLKSDGLTPLAGISIVVDSTEPAFLATADAGGRVRFDRTLEGGIEFFLEGQGDERYRAVLPESGEKHARDVVLPVDP